MFAKVLDTKNRKLCLFVKIKCSGTKKFRVWTEQYQKKNSKYSDRQFEVQGERTIFLNFPVTPGKLFLGVANCVNVKDEDYEITLMEGPLKSYNIWMDENSKQFVKFATHFCKVSGFETGTQTGRPFRSSNGKFLIKYFDVIRDFASGKLLGTPARIGHQSGKIDVSKMRFDKYTIPMRMMILLHEFSHKWKNPKIGLEINDEIGADINALYIYLGLGYSKIDAICVYANVFLKAQTKSNIERMRKIMDYIQKFENQEFAYKKNG
jgi:hypothetical protein